MDWYARLLMRNVGNGHATVPPAYAKAAELLESRGLMKLAPFDGPRRTGGGEEDGRAGVWYRCELTPAGIRWLAEGG